MLYRSNGSSTSSTTVVNYYNDWTWVGSEASVQHTLLKY